jgi:hypothetical protein
MRADPPMMGLHRIDLAPSRYLAVALWLAHGAAAGTVWSAALPLWMTCGTIAAIAGGLAWSCYTRAALRGRRAIVALEVFPKGRVAFLERGGTWRACELLGTSYVSPCLTILNLRPVGSRFVRHVILVPDNVDARHFRQLRAWLRWAPKPDLSSDHSSNAFQ